MKRNLPRPLCDLITDDGELVTIRAPRPPANTIGDQRPVAPAPRGLPRVAKGRADLPRHVGDLCAVPERGDEPQGDVTKAHDAVSGASGVGVVGGDG